MPLAFQSLNFGTVAFGFFNIESDMLLLERYFFFASDFCKTIGELTDQSGAEEVSLLFKVHEIEDRTERGDLMGAIHKVRLQGFIGDTYREFPFPDKPEDFKQNPDGDQNREIFEKLIAPYSNETEIQITAKPSDSKIAIGQYKFSKEVFFELLNYVWRGGYPRFKNDVKPGYVEAMVEKTQKSNYSLFSGLVY